MLGEGGGGGQVWKGYGIWDEETNEGDDVLCGRRGSERDWIMMNRDQHLPCS